MNWHPVWDYSTTVRRTVEWYRSVNEGACPIQCCFIDLNEYINSTFKPMNDIFELKQVSTTDLEYSRKVHGQYLLLDPSRKPWDQSHPILTGRVFTEDEVEAAVSATLDFWLTLGSENALQNELSNFLGVKSLFS